MSSFTLGYQAKLYRNTGSYVSPTWVEVTNVKDVKLNLEKDETDVTTRTNSGWKATAFTLKDAGVEFDMVWDPSDAGFAAVLSAFLNDTTIEVLVLDGSVSTTGKQGLRAEMGVKNCSRDEKLTDALMANVQLKPTYSSHAPTWYTVP